MNKEKVKKILRIVGDVLLYIFIGICLIGVIITISSKKNEDGTASIFGMQMRLVLTESMAKSEYTDVSEFEIKDIPVNSMIFIEEVPEDDAEAKEWYSKLEVGDVLTFKYVYTRQETITHRIVEIKENEYGTGYIITLEGDNKSSATGAMQQVIDTSERHTSPDYIIGKVTGQSYILGLFLTILRSPLGLIFIVIVPSLVIITLEVIKIVKMATADKKEKERKEKEEQQNELDMLKRRLAELEQLKASPPAAESAPTEAESEPAESSVPTEEN